MWEKWTGHDDEPFTRKRRFIPNSPNERAADISQHRNQRRHFAIALGESDQIRRRFGEDNRPINDVRGIRSFQLWNYKGPLPQYWQIYFRFFATSVNGKRNRVLLRQFLNHVIEPDAQSIAT